MAGRPKSRNSESEKELDKAEEQFEKFDKSVKEMTLDRMNQAPKQELEPQTKIARSDLEKKKDIYLKPIKTVSCRDKFNEKFRQSYEFDKQYVHFIAEHKEVIGDNIDIWTRPYGGMPAEEWLVPTNSPIWGPRYLADQIKKKKYHRLVMKNHETGADGMASYYGTMSVDTEIQRLDAHPVSTRKSIFMSEDQYYPKVA